MNKYEWKNGSRCSGNAQIVGEELDRIKAKAGSLTAETVVKAAKSKRSPLHRFFEWDDSAAAKAHRKDQARHLIRSVTIKWDTNTEEPRVIRAFVNVASGGEYEPIAVALSSEDIRARTLKQAYSELTALQRKYSDLEELARVFAEVDAFGEKVAA